MWFKRLGVLLLLTPFALASPLYYWAMHYAGGWFVDTDLPPDHRAFHLLETYWLLMLMISCLTTYCGTLFLFLGGYKPKIMGWVLVPLTLPLLLGLLLLYLFIDAFIKFS